MSDAVDAYRAWMRDTRGWMPTWVRAKADAAIAALEAELAEMTNSRNYWQDATMTERAALRKAGNELLRRYTELVDSGDAGFWDWREERECQNWIALQPRKGDKVSR